jgi:hypothetical protein
VLVAGAGGVEVDGREDPPVGAGPVERQLGVAGAFELLVDQRVAARAGVDQRAGDDGQRAAAVDGPGRAEQALRRGEGGGADAAGQGAAVAAGRVVVRAAEPGQRVHHDDHVAAELHQPLGPLDGELGDRGVVLGRTVER